MSPLVGVSKLNVITPLLIGGVTHSMCVADLQDAGEVA